ncbi:hypothetical protein GOB46_21030 [Sinorhizobium meliloti]|uniref:hypothetical protein n=1 Tax=Sinorhizobium TaxID=28105 RepID=UPI00037E8377|nr:MULTISPECIES: hypothetical protein [Sinorhizobium]MDE3797621.1 hypothetical protein [Sinorhizobium meliloti]MDW9818195.1 hypothetical protein [Sinorhizobium meliloti]MDW9855043.1 hypothetical protein [Sinorhizobium meliloti]MDW9872689.1 hypothetical protein [Sinorhizobium meliloti]MDW9886342.1 hypothetical protein [Sinorhizobium meliloti]
MTLREQLILVSDEFGRARGIGRQRVSTIVLNRGSTLDLLAQGRSDLNTGTFERAMIWFSENWPEGAEWPAGVPRPVLQTEAAE